MLIRLGAIQRMRVARRFQGPASHGVKLGDPESVGHVLILCILSGSTEVGRGCRHPGVKQNLSRLCGRLDASSIEHGRNPHDRSATHELSSWSPPLPRQILPSPIFNRSMHLAPQILFPPPSLFRCHASTGHHRFPHRLTISILTKIRPFVPYACATFSCYLNTPSGMSYPNPYFTDTSTIL